MAFVNNTCSDFVDLLAAKDAVPGGGGASAYVGAIGMALGSMVGNLTTGKKKYADVEDDIINLLERAKKLQNYLLRLVDEDAVVFEPLSKAYAIPKDDPGREIIMEDALKLACTVPLEIMSCCAKAIELLDEFSQKGSKIALSDAGVGVVFCKAALQGASLNVFINTKVMTDRKHAIAVETKAELLLNKYCITADKVYEYVNSQLR